MNIIVLAGGLSTERDVSFSTGEDVCKALRERGHQAAMLDVFLGYEGDVSEDFFVRNDAIRSDDKKIKSIDPDLDQIKQMRGDSEDGFFGPNVLALCRKADIVYMALHGADGENGKVQAAFDLLGIRYTGSGCVGSAVAMDKGLVQKDLFGGRDPNAERIFRSQRTEWRSAGRYGISDCCETMLWWFQRWCQYGTEC